MVGMEYQKDLTINASFIRESEVKVTEQIVGTERIIYSRGKSYI